MSERKKGEHLHFRDARYDRVVMPASEIDDAIDGSLLLAGAGLAWRHTVRAGILPTHQSPFTTGLEQELSNVVVAGTVGFDAVFVFSPRTALVSTGRYQLLNDDDRDAVGLVRRGVASTVFRFGMGTRFAF